MKNQNWIKFIAAVTLIVSTTACEKADQLDASEDKSAKSEYDGTYHWSLSNVNGINSSCFNCVFIKDGKISNTGGTFFGSVNVDKFGNITFQGICPNGNNSTADYSGKQGGSTWNAWQGTWTCDDNSVGGPNSVWKLFEK